MPACRRVCAADPPLAVHCQSRDPSPIQRNAFDDTMIAGIDSFFGDSPEQTRAVMHSEGKHFSAGAVPVRIDWR
jgi:hypothetical protein